MSWLPSRARVGAGEGDEEGSAAVAEAEAERVGGLGEAAVGRAVVVAGEDDVGAGGHGHAGGVVAAEGLEDLLGLLAEGEAVEIDVGADVDLEPLAVLVRGGVGVGHDLGDHQVADGREGDVAPLAVVVALVLGGRLRAGGVVAAGGAEVALAVGVDRRAPAVGVVVALGGGEGRIQAAGGAVGGAAVGDRVDELEGRVGDEEAAAAVVEGEAELVVRLREAAVGAAVELAGEDDVLPRGDRHALGVVLGVEGLEDVQRLLAEVDPVEIDGLQRRDLEPLAVAVVDDHRVGVELVDHQIAGGWRDDRPEHVAVPALALGRRRLGARGVLGLG